MSYLAKIKFFGYSGTPITKTVYSYEELQVSRDEAIKEGWEEIQSGDEIFPNSFLIVDHRNIHLVA